ncbi:MAG: MobA/MobL family protein [Beijerinckiaceae bacterium]|nr:MobA/MobL family protein [Beijerinckiaceae bacterium]
MADNGGGLFVDNSKKIQRLLKRAAEQSIRAQKRQIRATGKIARQMKQDARAANRIAQAFAKALKAGKAGKGPRDSIRMTAPDTGGRSFHFSHTAVSARQPDTGGGAGRHTQASRGSAHMGYIERPEAIERGAAPDLGPGAELGDDDGPGADRLRLREALERDPSKVRFDEDLDIAMPKARAADIEPAADVPWRDPVTTEDGAPELSEAEKRALDADLGLRPMQGYLERDGALEGAAGRDGVPRGPSQDANGFSFGTIGETREERLAFWDLVETHKERVNAVLQHRLILELPHEVTPAVRLAIVKSFTKRFEDEGIPYWAVLHAPTDRNDARNFHAHIVHLTRPAKIILHPEGGDIASHVGPKRLVPTWDFAAVSYVPDEFRVTRKRYPHRGKTFVRNDVRGKPGHVEKERKRFADVANAELEKAGSAIRYDHRSYKDMGLDVRALGSLSRKVLDQVRAGKRTVENSGLTERLLRAITERAARKQIRVLKTIDAEIAALPAPPVMRSGRLGPARTGNAAADQADTAKRMAEFRKHAYRIAPDSDATADDILALKHRELAVRRNQAAAAVAAEVETARLKHIVEVTDPDHFLKVARALKAVYEKRRASGRPSPEKTRRDETFRKKQLEGLPDFKALGAIHRSARLELELHQKETAKAEASYRGILGNLAMRAGAFKRSRPDPTPAMKTVLAEIQARAMAEAEAEAARQAFEAARRKRIIEQVAMVTGGSAIDRKRPMPLMPAIMPAIEAIQAYILESVDPNDPTSYDRMYRGVGELARELGELRRTDPRHAMFKIDPDVARQYGVPERNARKTAIEALRAGGSSIKVAAADGRSGAVEINPAEREAVTEATPSTTTAAQSSTEATPDRQAIGPGKMPGPYTVTEAPPVSNTRQPERAAACILDMTVSESTQIHLPIADAKHSQSSAASTSAPTITPPVDHTFDEPMQATLATEDKQARKKRRKKRNRRKAILAGRGH